MTITTKAEALEALDRIDGNEYTPYTTAALRDYIERDRWVSVEERMPEELTEVVVFVKNSGTTWLGEYDTEDPHEPHFNVEGLGRIDVSRVTHWQPLPSPPKTK